MKNKLLPWLFGLLMAITTTITAQTKMLHTFKNPSLLYRMGLNTHSIPHDQTLQDSILRHYLNCGYGSLATNVNWTTDYLDNEEEIQSMFRFARSAKSQGMKVWLYDENWYPSGMANTYILDKHPEWECEGLLFKSIEVKGKEKISVPLLPGRIVAIQALPLADGTPQIEKAHNISLGTMAETLNWTAPEGSWLVVMISTNRLREGFQAGTERGNRVLNYPSLLMPEVGKRFVELTHKRYAAVLGEKLSSLFFATFTDEPSSMALPYRELGYGVYPWKANISVEFEKRSGHKLSDDLLWIMLDKGEKGQRARVIYFQIIADFMSNHYFKLIKDYCHSQGILSGGHLLLEEDMMAHAVLYGDIMACYREMDIPGIDVLTGMPDFTRRYLYSARLASSAAELEGNSAVMTEICPIADHAVYEGKEAPIDDVRGTINRQMVGGVTLFNNYLQLEHECVEGKNQFNKYVARIAESLSGGTRSAKIAVYYPIETMWSYLRPVASGLANWDKVSGGALEAQSHARTFEAISDYLYDNQYEFSYLDSKGIVASEVRQNKLVHSNLSWEVIILPDVRTIPDEALKRLVDFSKAGGKLIVLETFPENSLSEFPSQRVSSLVDELKQSKNCFYMREVNKDSLNKVIEKGALREIIFTNNDKILMTHRHISGKEIFFIVNDSPEEKQVGVRLPQMKSVLVCDPVTGNSIREKSSFEIKLNPYQGIIVKALKK